MKEVTIHDVVYRCGKLNAFKQLHVARRLTPCLSRLGPLLSEVGQDKALQITRGSDGGIQGVEGDFAAILEPLGEAVSALRDDDLDYILCACLDVTERKQSGGGWAPLRSNGTIMYDGMALPALLQIAYTVVVESLGDFFTGAPSSGLAAFMKAQGLNG